MEVPTRPLLFTAKKEPSPWNFQGHLSAPDLGLACSNLPCVPRMSAGGVDAHED